MCAIFPAFTYTVQNTLSDITGWLLVGREATLTDSCSDLHHFTRSPGYNPNTLTKSRMDGCVNISNDKSHALSQTKHMLPALLPGLWQSMPSVVCFGNFATQLQVFDKPSCSVRLRQTIPPLEVNVSTSMRSFCYPPDTVYHISTFSFWCGSGIRPCG